MRVAWVIASAVAMTAASVQAQTVRTGIEAWQKGDSAAAVAAWRPLANSGDADAQFNLAQAYKLGRGVPLDLGHAQFWFDKAARQGHSEAQTNLGMLLFQNGNRTAALRWLKSAAEASDARALLIYGTALFNGDGVPVDRVKAYAMVSYAAAQGFPAAKDTLAEMDELIPLAERQKGVALALQWSKPAAAAKPIVPASARPPAKASPVKKPAFKQTATPKSASPTASSGNWRIQLGAFSQRSGAEALFHKLAPSMPGKQPLFVPVGAMTRLQAGPYPTRAAANEACRALSARGQACFPVAGR